MKEYHVKQLAVFDCHDLKICLRHHFEMSKFPICALSGYNRALGIFKYDL